MKDNRAPKGRTHAHREGEKMKKREKERRGLRLCCQHFALIVPQPIPQAPHCRRGSEAGKSLKRLSG
jgi:hypothetical protein